MEEATDEWADLCGAKVVSFSYDTGADINADADVEGGNEKVITFYDAVAAAGRELTVPFSHPDLHVILLSFSPWPKSFNPLVPRWARPSYLFPLPYQPHLLLLVGQTSYYECPQ